MLVLRPAITPEPDSASRSTFAWEETACLLCGRDEATVIAEAAVAATAEPG